MFLTSLVFHSQFRPLCQLRPLCPLRPLLVVEVVVVGKVVVYYSIGRFYYIIGQLLHYRAFFITLSGTYYVQYRVFITFSVGTTLIPGPRRYSLHTNPAALRWTPSSLLKSPTWCESQIAQQYSNLERTRA